MVGNAKYWDLYTVSNESAKIGDALGTSKTTNPGCAGWHSAGRTNWISDIAYNFGRGGEGLFSYSRQNFYSDDYIGAISSSAMSRGVAVVGEGF